MSPERWSVEQYKAYLRGQEPATHAAGKRTAKQKKDLALLVLLKRASEELDIHYGGEWKRGMEVEDRYIYGEFPFSTKRKFRADLAIPSLQVMVEIQGGAYVPRYKKDGTFCGYGGGHHSKEGRRRDIEKSNLANLEGWLCLECEWSDIEDGTAFDWLAEAVRSRP
jgi:hypothetical protein